MPKKKNTYKKAALAMVVSFVKNVPLVGNENIHEEAVATNGLNFEVLFLKSERLLRNATSITSLACSFSPQCVVMFFFYNKVTPLGGRII